MSSYTNGLIFGQNCVAKWIETDPGISIKDISSKLENLQDSKDVDEDLKEGIQAYANHFAHQLEAFGEAGVIKMSQESIAA